MPRTGHYNRGADRSFTTTRKESLPCTSCPSCPTPSTPSSPTSTRAPWRSTTTSTTPTYVTNLNKALEGHPTCSDARSTICCATSTGARGDPPGGAQQRRRPRQPHPVLGDHGAGGGGAPSGDLAAAIDQAFGSFAGFKEKLTAAAVGQFGSGWGWLVLDGGKLAVIAKPEPGQPPDGGQEPASWASTCGSTPTTSSTRTAAPTTSRPGGTWSTGRRSWRASARPAADVRAHFRPRPSSRNTL